MEKKEHGKLGLLACVALLAGGCIGSSIFSLSGMTMYYAGPASILSWLIAAFILCLYGLLVSELAIRYPKSGGVYLFPSKALGNSPKVRKGWAFIASWGYMFSNIIAVGFAAIYVGTFLSVGFEALGGLTWQIILGVLAVVLVVVLNLLKITSAGRANNFLVGALVICMLIFAVIAFTSGTWNGANFQNFFGQGAKGNWGFLQAVPNAMTGYGSIVAIAFMVGEVKNPNRTVPKSLAIALILVVCLYMLMIIATMGNIQTQLLIDNPGFRYIPMYAAAFTSLASVPWLSKLISIAAVIANLTTMLVVLSLNSRAVSSMADDGMMPKFLAFRNKNGVPAGATLFLGFFCAVLACLPHLTEILVNMGSFIAATTIMIVCISYIAAVKKVPYVEGNFKVPGGLALAIIAIVLILISYIPGFINGDPMMWLFTAIIYVSGIILMFVALKNSEKKGLLN